MDPILIASLGLVGMFLLIALHVPIGVAMGLAGVIGYGLLNDFGPALTLLSTEPVSVLSSADLAVIPLFLLMGSLANVSGLSADIYRLAYALIGHYPGGLALATIGGCAGFGAVCGSSIATAATMGRVALPEMRARGYADTLATGCVAAGGTLGMLIPPSVIMVIYAFLAEQFVIALFVAALLPAALAILMHVLAILVVVGRDPGSAPAGDRLPWAERLAVFRQSWGVVVLLLSITGGIYLGVFTVSEAAAVGAGIALVFALFRRRLNRETAALVVRDTASNTAMIYLIIMGASVFGYFIADSRLPEALGQWVTEAGIPPLLVVLVLVLVYLVLGCVFDTVASMLITMPFVLPVILGLGYDPIWWGIVLVMVLEVGMITPPIGMNVFVIHGVAKTVRLGTIFRGILPFFYADMVRILAIVLFPGIALWLPRQLGF